MNVVCCAVRDGRCSLLSYAFNEGSFLVFLEFTEASNFRAKAVIFVEPFHELVFIVVGERLHAH